MSLFISLLPVYLFGNLHCLGMCGPLVMLLGKHRFRYVYFLGRTLSFSLVGLLSAEMGILVGAFFKEMHIQAMTSLLFGALSLWIAFSYMSGDLRLSSWIGKKLAPLNRQLSLLLLKDTPWTTFLFGFLTIALPCGQTILVFSALALSESPMTGLLNGFAFACLTSPSLMLALHAHKLLPSKTSFANRAIVISGILVGLLAICRSLAEWELIPHLVFNQDSPTWLHLVLF